MSLVVMDVCDGHTSKVYICHNIFSRQTNQCNKMLVHVSYPYITYLESRPKIQNLSWMDHVKTLCNIFVTEVHRKKKPKFCIQKKTKQKTFDWFSHFKHVFVFYTSFLVQSILKQKFDCLLKLSSWLEHHIQLKENQPSLFDEMKIYKNEFLNV